MTGERTPMPSDYQAVRTGPDSWGWISRIGGRIETRRGFDSRDDAALDAWRREEWKRSYERWESGLA